MVDVLALADLFIGRVGATTLAELEALDIPAVLIPLPASVSRGDQLDNASAYSGRCVVVPDDDDLRGGAGLVAACESLAANTRRRGAAAPLTRVHEAAAHIARITLKAAARSGSRR
jgi:UDP-N-acetylglucosamine--N-acetylmuramyl-(pentapeptide) pyrophosphoryl-undecaprenol N-acetylglucosamine transferase